MKRIRPMVERYHGNVI
ncbi:hypothetical protein F383_39452 [Gossypium arboreum]|uniref:Uncharacterized protein n=1 Tax=Gossypium arboreum TaxID=29729 RepID=A0A0B0MSM4_GOSAR|nr:hypothetical protein F383_39452 [Gossypium arboreum]